MRREKNIRRAGYADSVGDGGPVSTKDTRQPHSLVEEYYDYVAQIVQPLIRTMGLPLSLREDFMSAGFLGLVEAAERFDPQRGGSFRTFAYLRIRGAVIDHIRASCDISRKSYHMLKSLDAAQSMRDVELENRGRSNHSHSSGRIGALAYLSKSASAFKLTAMVQERAQAYEDAPDSPERILNDKRQSDRIRRLVSLLPEKERMIIEQYYFHDRSFTDIAKGASGLSKSWISRLHDRALEMLRTKLLREIAGEGG